MRTIYNCQVFRLGSAFTIIIFNAVEMKSIEDKGNIVHTKVYETYQLHMALLSKEHKTCHYYMTRDTRKRRFSYSVGSRSALLDLSTGNKAAYCANARYNCRLS